MRYLIMKQTLLIFLLATFSSCNSYHDKMSGLLGNKKDIEIAIDSNQAKDQRFREITGYSEILDSLSTSTEYEHPELVDSIFGLKIEKEFLSNELKKIKYSIDSLEKLK